MNRYRDYVPVYVTRPFGTHKTTGRISVRMGTIVAVKFVTLGNVLGWGAYGLLELVRKAVGA